MECRCIKEKLSVFIDNMLSPEEKMQVDEHLKSCPECSLYLNELKKTVAYTQGIGEIESPPWLTQKVMAKVREEAESKKGIFHKLFYPLHIKIPIEVVATVAIAITAVYVFKTVEPVMKQERMPSEQVMILEQEEKKKMPADRLLTDKETPLKAPAPVERQKFDKPLDALAGKTEEFKTPALAKEKTVQQETDKASDMEMKEAVKKLLLREERALLFSQEMRKDIVLTLYVDDIKSAFVQTEEIIKSLGGKIAGTESFEDRQIVISKFDSKKLNELKEKLKSVGLVRQVGEIKDKTADSGISRDIVIEIIKISVNPR